MLACPGLESSLRIPGSVSGVLFGQRQFLYQLPLRFLCEPSVTYGIGVGKVLVREGRRFPSKARKGGWEGDELRYGTGSHEELALGMYWRERNLKKVSGKELYAGVLSGGKQREGQGCSHHERKEQT